MTAELLEIAREHHLAGRLAEAEALYEDLLANDPRNAEVLNLLGLIAEAKGEPARGAELIARAIAVLDFPRFRNNLGMVFGRLGRHLDALDAYDKALAAWPAYPEALNNRGATLQALGRLEEAAGSFQAAVTARPDYVEAWSNLGDVLRHLGRPKEAETAYIRALSLKPDAPGLDAGLGGALLSQGRAAEAETVFRRQLEKSPEDPAGFDNLAAALSEQNNNSEAEQVLLRAASVAPGRPETARNLAVVLQKLGRLDEAEVVCRRTLALHPDHPGALEALGSILREHVRLEEAEAAQRRFIARYPAAAAGYRNLALTLEEQRRPHEALALLDLAIGLVPSDPEARHHRALLLLRQGRMSDGWMEYEARFQTSHGRPNKLDFAFPRWTGERLDGRSILLHSEQGYGDTIQFLRYAPMVVARGGRVQLLVPSRLQRLASNLPGVSVLPPDATFPIQSRPFDFYCPLMSLPLAFGTTCDKIPATVPYLHPPSEALERWRIRFPPVPERRVGIAWSGNPKHLDDRRRSVPFAALAPLWDAPGLRWVSLQLGPPAENLRRLPQGTVEDVEVEQTDFAETAALISQLDLVITVDTAVAHLAGGLGVPVWTMLMANPDWRWLADRDTTPWYPTMRLFRQGPDRSWDPVVRRIAALLREEESDPDLSA